MEIFPSISRRYFELFSAQNVLCSESRLGLVGKDNRRLQAGTKIPHDTHTAQRRLQLQRIYHFQPRPCSLLLSFPGQVLFNLAAWASAGSGPWGGTCTPRSWRVLQDTAGTKLTSLVCQGRSNTDPQMGSALKTLSWLFQKQRTVTREEASLCPGEIRSLISCLGCVLSTCPKSAWLQHGMDGQVLSPLVGHDLHEKDCPGL